MTGLQTRSDSIGMIPIGGGQFELVFNSDEDGGPEVTVNCSLPQVFSCTAETGQPVDVGPVVYGVDSGIHIFVTSDLDPVPEPASLGLLCAGALVTLLARAKAKREGAGEANMSGPPAAVASSGAPASRHSPPDPDTPVGARCFSRGAAAAEPLFVIALYIKVSSVATQHKSGHRVCQIIKDFGRRGAKPAR